MIPGASLASTIKVLAGLGSLGQKVLKQNGITEIDPKKNYPGIIRLKIFDEVRERFGEEALFTIGIEQGLLMLSMLPPFGNYVSTFNLSTTLPQLLPSFQNTDISVFFDAANIWGVDYNSSLDDNSKIRSATGVALDLMTPIGPLNFSLSQPISKASTDITESFRFNLGTTF